MQKQVSESLPSVLSTHCPSPPDTHTNTPFLVPFPTPRPYPWYSPVMRHPVPWYPTLFHLTPGIHALVLVPAQHPSILPYPLYHPTPLVIPPCDLVSHP